MKYIQTTALRKILAMKERLKVIQGGTGAGKTIAVLLLLIDKAQTTEGKLISVVSETVPHLKRGALRDFLNIMESHKYYSDTKYNKTDYIYTFETGSKIEFFSADNFDKVRGPRRDILFINECNNINYNTYTQLVIRTNEEIYVDYNPVSSFWIQEEIIPKTEHDFIVLTYKDNEALPETIVKEIESRRGNKNFWKVFGEGLLGDTEGKIYKDWKIIDEIPHEARLERRALDFGYTNDPTAIVDIYYYNGGYIFDEIAFQKGLSNQQIADSILLQPQKTLVIADSAEPKSIDEIKLYGVDIIGAIKGPDSVVYGIQLVQDQEISVTKRSINIIKEYRNYVWITDRDGKILNKPDHAFSHSMDAIRYGMTSLEETEAEDTREERRRISTNRQEREKTHY